MERSVRIYDKFDSLLVDSSIDAIIATEMDGRIMAWNHAAEIIFGKRAVEVKGSLLTRTIEGMEEDAEGMKCFTLAVSGCKCFAPADQHVPYRSHTETHYIPLQCQDTGNQIGVMQIVHDVSHRIKAERKLEELNEILNRKNYQLERALDEMADFTVIRNNNIKTPIRTLYTDIEFLIKNEAKHLSDSGKATFRRMQASLNKMNLLLDDMLQLSAISIARPSEKVDLNEILTAVSEKIKPRMEERNAVLEIGRLCVITGDAELLHKLFYQLIDNAIKFNESPQPQIKVHCTEVSWTSKLDLHTGNYYRVSITDNGPGIPADDVERAFMLFEKLHNNKSRGSGLGLTLARKIMDMHNGFISLESPGGKGTTCNCYFPVV